MEEGQERDSSSVEERVLNLTSLTGQVLPRCSATSQGDPDKYPTVWVCMYTRKCMVCYNITDKNTSPMNDHLTHVHNLEKKMGHDKKVALSTHQEQLQKQEAQVNKNGMSPNRFHQLQVALFVIQSCQVFVVVEKQAFRNLLYKDWIPCTPESIRSTVGEIFLSKKQKQQGVLSFRNRSGGMTVASFLATYS